MPSGWIALTREVSPRIVECELVHLARTPIDVGRARSQHAEYERALRSMGVDVRRVAPAPDHPDAVFLEDAAVVLDEVAVITRPGALSRRGELAAVEEGLRPLRKLARITEPGTVDGGDVLVAGRRVFVGRTSRTNEEGITQMRRLLAPFGYTVEGVAVTGCLHLKSAATAIDDATLLANPAWVSPEALAALELVTVDPAEPMAANIVRVGDRHLYARSYPRTLDRLIARGLSPTLVDADELAKAEGAVTCCSLLVRVP